MFGFLIALLSGALMSIQGVLNTGLTRQPDRHLAFRRVGPAHGFFHLSHPLALF